MPPPMTRISASVVEVMMRRILPCGDRSVYVPRFTLAIDRDRLAHAGRLLRADVLVLRLSRPAPRGVPVVARRGRGRLLALGGRAGLAVPGRWRDRRSRRPAARDPGRRRRARAVGRARVQDRDAVAPLPDAWGP